MTTQPQPLDLDTIQAAYDVAPGQWWNDSFEIYAGEPGIPAASTWIGETCSVNLSDGGEANAIAIVTAHNALPTLIARVRELQQQLDAYEALQLDGPNGRISNSCVLGIHPTWLRDPDDTRYYACPWCALDDAARARDSR